MKLDPQVGQAGRRDVLVEGDAGDQLPRSDHQERDVVPTVAARGAQRNKVLVTNDSVNLVQGAVRNRIRNISGFLSGAQMGSNPGQNRGRKYCDTLSLRKNTV